MKNKQEELTKTDIVYANYVVQLRALQNGEMGELSSIEIVFGKVIIVGIKFYNPYVDIIFVIDLVAQQGKEVNSP